MPDISLNSIVVIAPEQLSCDLDGDAALLNLKSGFYYGLTGVGGRIWELMRERRSVRQVLNQLLAEYDVDAASCERDLIALIGQLAAEGLVEVV